MDKIINSILLVTTTAFIYLGVNRNVFEQTKSPEKPVHLDKAWIIISDGFEANSRVPRTAYFLIEDPIDLSGIKKSNLYDFYCSLSKKGALFEEPMFTLNRNLTKLNFKNDLQKRAYLKRTTHEIELMNKFLTIPIRVKLSEGQVTVKIAKVQLDVWQIPLKMKSNYSDELPLGKECYEKEFVYNIKSIDKLYKITNSEIFMLKKMIGN